MSRAQLSARDARTWYGNPVIERMRVAEIFREYGIYVVLALLVLGFSIVAPSFASITNFILVLLQVSVMGILSIGMLFVILSRGIDLSVGSILAVSGMFAGLLAKQEFTFVECRAGARSSPSCLGCSAACSTARSLRG